MAGLQASTTAQSTNLWSVLLPSCGLACSSSTSSTWLARLAGGKTALCNALLAPAHVHDAVKSQLFVFCHAATCREIGCCVLVAQCAVQAVKLSAML